MRVIARALGLAMVVQRGSGAAGGTGPAGRGDRRRGQRPGGRFGPCQPDGHLSLAAMGPVLFAFLEGMRDRHLSVRLDPRCPKLVGDLDGRKRNGPDGVVFEAGPGDFFGPGSHRNRRDGGEGETPLGKLHGRLLSIQLKVRAKPSLASACDEGQQGLRDPRSGSHLGEEPTGGGPEVPLIDPAPGQDCTP